MSIRHLAIAALLVAVVPTLAACGGSSSGSSKASSEAEADIVNHKANPPICQTTGPNGEKSTPITDFKLTPEQTKKIQAGHYTAAMAWHTSDEVTASVERGADAAFKELGIEVVGSTNAEYQADKQSEQVRTILAKKPSILLSLPVDPTSTAAAYEAAAAAGTKLVFEDNAPEGFTKAGTNYVSVISSNQCQMGQQTAEALASAIGEEGEIGYIFHDADFYVTNRRDEAAKKTIEKYYPNVDISVEEGIADPSKAEEVANAMLTKHPELDGIYVTFGEVALGVLSALRNNGNTTTKIATMDLQEPLAIDMANGGPTVAIVAEGLYEDGEAMAWAGALAAIGQTVPPFIISEARTITKENLVQGYEESEHTEPPKGVMEALGG
ncbi:MAG: ribose transport system substrate-binding protein [Solirubrobacterales bacterium]|jgi:ribose transport system substrate-binding protein|nr:ribose transport system substrate-binding protein [Solirubrobacterales bacterium]